jgi:hypothetical protein
MLEGSSYQERPQNQPNPWRGASPSSGAPPEGTSQARGRPRNTSSSSGTMREEPSRERWSSVTPAHIRLGLTEGLSRGTSHSAERRQTLEDFLRENPMPEPAGEQSQGHSTNNPPSSSSGRMRREEPSRENQTLALQQLFHHQINH